MWLQIIGHLPKARQSLVRVFSNKRNNGVHKITTVMPWVIFVGKNRKSVLEIKYPSGRIHDFFFFFFFAEEVHRRQNFFDGNINHGWLKGR